jgi:hypothetical protein
MAHELNRTYRKRAGAGAPDGITRIDLTAGAARLAVEVGRPSLPLPPGPLPLPLRVQLHGEHGQCLEARFTGARRNDVAALRATAAD